MSQAGAEVGDDGGEGATDPGRQGAGAQGRTPDGGGEKLNALKKKKIEKRTILKNVDNEQQYLISAYD